MIFSLLPYLFPQSVLLKAIWKSKVSLNPPWRKVLKGDAVTLTCGTNGSSEDQSSLWIHNGTSFTMNNSRWHIVKARMQDSGEYQCRIKGFAISEPVYLNVISGKFQGYRSINSLMCGMAHLTMGRKQVIPRLREARWNSRSLSTYRSLSLLLPLLHLTFWLLSIFQQSPNVPPLVCFISIFSTWLQMHITWSNGILDM